VKLAYKEYIIRSKPVNLIEKDNFLFKNEYEKIFEEVEIKCFNKIFILPNGIMFNRKFLFHEYFNSQISFFSKIKAFLKSLNCLFYFKSVRVINDGIIITDSSSSGFFHWFGDVLQKIEKLEINYKTYNRHSIVVPYIFDNSLSRETLSKYNFKIVFLKKNEVAKIIRAIYVPLISPTGNFRPQLMENLRNRFNITYQGKKNRIYISRSKAQKRRLINEDEIISFLVENHFTIINMEDYSFNEQIEFLSKADILVSIHGAALTNMLWMPRGSKILEIRLKNDFVNNCYFSLASSLELEYYYFLANPNDINKSTQLTDFIIDTHNFKEQLRILLN